MTTQEITAEAKGSVGPDDSVTKVGFLRKKGFVFVDRIGRMFESGLPNLAELDSCGTYAITTPEGYQVGFISPDAAHERGNVSRPWSLEELREKWVESVDILYYGFAGRMSLRPLRERLNDLIQHGSGSNATAGRHHGGEILWQLIGYEGFRVYRRF
jgi:hypothetical protein